MAKPELQPRGEPELRLDDCQEEALRDGRGIIIQGVLYAKREDVPAKWFRNPARTGEGAAAGEDPTREENRRRRRELAGLRRGVLEKKTVEELRALAGSLRLGAAGLKADLVARILTAEGHPTAEGHSEPAGAEPAGG